MPENLFFATFNSPLGYINLVSDDSYLLTVSFADIPSSFTYPVPQVLRHTLEQLASYFEGNLTTFSIPVNPHGTLFQKRVWEKLLLIPYGETKSYRDVAISLGSPLYDRAVGSANGKNPIPVLIPCHRIIGKGGRLTGYAGGIWRKKWLLEHELKYSPVRKTLF